MTQQEAITIIEAERQEAIAAGVEPYALILDSELYHALDGHEPEGFERIVHDPLIIETREGKQIAVWDEHQHEDAEEAWLDIHGY